MLDTIREYARERLNETGQAVRLFADSRWRLPHRALDSTPVLDLMTLRPEEALQPIVAAIRFFEGSLNVADCLNELGCALIVLGRAAHGVGALGAVKRFGEG